MVRVMAGLISETTLDMEVTVITTARDVVQDERVTVQTLQKMLVPRDVRHLGEFLLDDGARHEVLRADVHGHQQVRVTGRSRG